MPDDSVEAAAREDHSDQTFVGDLTHRWVTRRQTYNEWW